MNIYEELQKVCKILEKEMDSKTKSNFKNTDFSDLINYHFSLGIWIRNNILTENSAILDYFKGVDMENLDEISFFIIQNLYIYLKSK